MTLHKFHLRLLAEHVVRRRPADDREQYAAAHLERDIADLIEGHIRSRGIRYARTDADGRVVFDLADDANLVPGMGETRRFVTGDGRGFTDAQLLNPSHPLVRASIEEARAWQGGLVELIPDATPEVTALQTRTGVLAIALVDYAGFAPVQRIVTAGIVGGVPIHPALASRLAKLPAAHGPDIGVTVHEVYMRDALDEAVRLDEREVQQQERTHFQRAMDLLEQSVEDDVSQCHRERASISERLRSARDERERAVDADRDRIDAEILGLVENDDVLERRIEALVARRDPEYLERRNEYDDLRQRAPKVTRLFQVAFRIAARNPSITG